MHNRYLYLTVIQAGKQSGWSLPALLRIREQSSGSVENAKLDRRIHVRRLARARNRRTD